MTWGVGAYNKMRAVSYIILLVTVVLGCTEIRASEAERLCTKGEPTASLMNMLREDVKPIVKRGVEGKGLSKSDIKNLMHFGEEVEAYSRSVGICEQEYRDAWTQRCEEETSTGSFNGILLETRLDVLGDTLRKIQGNEGAGVTEAFLMEAEFMLGEVTRYLNCEESS